MQNAKIQMGIIGVGNMGSSHALHLSQGLVPDIQLAAVCDTNPARLDWAKASLPADVKLFATAEELFGSGAVDAVLIAVPHYDHPRLAIQAFQSGCHVLVEKPAGVYTSQVREMNQAAAESGKVYCIMYNQRTNPVYQKVRRIVQEGELGPLKRVVWIITNWYRSQSYYDSGGWRATWAGEGGGVLLNQDPHQLDLLQWICGMPDGVHAFMGYGVHRNIEVENDVTAYLTYPGGATGVFITSTHETPGTNRLEISGDRGKIVVENNEVTFWRTEVGEAEWNKTSTTGFAQPDSWVCSIPAAGDGKSEHVKILHNFAGAILRGEPLLAPGEEGINGLSISNAMHLSAWTGQTVNPASIDEALFNQLLQQRIDTSTYQKITTDVCLDVTGSH